MLLALEDEELIDGDLAPPVPAPPEAWLMLDVDAVGLGGEEDEELVLFALPLPVKLVVIDWLADDAAIFDAAAVAVDAGLVIICSFCTHNKNQIFWILWKFKFAVV